MRPILVFDMEVYINFTFLMFKDVTTKQVTQFELPLADFELEMLRDIVCENTLITFNGTGYDIPLLMLILERNANSEKVKVASDRIIVQHLKWWNFEREFKVNTKPDVLDHVDLMEVAPLTGSLKVYGGRLHSRHLQDLPIKPSKTVTEEDKAVLRKYCGNDLDTTIDLYNALTVQLQLRAEMSKTYGIDLRSKSDAQIAEAVIKKEVEAIIGRQLDRPGMGAGDRFLYKIPSWMDFEWCDILSTIEKTYFSVSDKGGVLMPTELASKAIRMGTGLYRMGIGGLHSSETKQIRKADDDHVMMDFDVVSYYPKILLNQGLFPQHIGEPFLKVYNGLVEQRLAAKKAGNKTVAESLKITINGTFGKLASKYSVLYSPDLFIQITVTGQLALLMLIEAFWDVDGCEVVSANTDGVTVRCPKAIQQQVCDVAKQWEARTGFELERADYAALYSRDVNNYIAIKTDGEVKTKGVYGIGLPLHKNPNSHICSTAVISYLKRQTPIRQTIEGCQDIREFLCLRKVEGGAVHHGKEIGRVIRWYYSTLEDEALTYKLNDRLVPKTFGAVPCMTLPERLPADLDHEWYIAETQSMLVDMGVL